MNHLSVTDCFDSLVAGDVRVMTPPSLLVFIGQGYCHRVHRNETHLILVSCDDETNKYHELHRIPIGNNIFELFLDLANLANYEINR